MMKLNCPACGESFEDESELSVTLKLVDHLKSIPETEHILQLAAMLKELERLIAQDESPQRQRRTWTSGRRSLTDARVLTNG